MNAARDKNTGLKNDIMDGKHYMWISRFSRSKIIAE